MRTRVNWCNILRITVDAQWSNKIFKNHIKINLTTQKAYNLETLLSKIYRLYTQASDFQCYHILVTQITCNLQHRIQKLRTKYVERCRGFATITNGFFFSFALWLNIKLLISSDLSNACNGFYYTAIRVKLCRYGISWALEGCSVEYFWQMVFVFGAWYG